MVTFADGEGIALLRFHNSNRLVVGNYALRRPCSMKALPRFWCEENRGEEGPFPRRRSSLE